MGLRAPGGQLDSPGGQRPSSWLESRLPMMEQAQLGFTCGGHPAAQSAGNLERLRAPVQEANELN